MKKFPANHSLPLSPQLQVLPLREIPCRQKWRLWDTGTSSPHSAPLRSPFPPTIINITLPVSDAAALFDVAPGMVCVRQAVSMFVTLSFLRCSTKSVQRVPARKHRLGYLCQSFRPYPCRSMKHRRLWGFDSKPHKIVNFSRVKGKKFPPAMPYIQF